MLEDNFHNDPISEMYKQSQEEFKRFCDEELHKLRNEEFEEMYLNLMI